MQNPNPGQDPQQPPTGIPGQVPNPGHDPLPDQPIDPLPDRPTDPAPGQPIDPTPDRPTDPVQFPSHSDNADVEHGDPLGTPGSVIP